MKTKILSLALAGALIASMVDAGGHQGNPAVKARQAHMSLNGFNMGMLGGMARGRVDYDAETAKAAAENLASLAAMDQGRYWPPGTDNATIEDTRALPALWETFPAVLENAEALKTSSAALAAVAGNGLEALQGAIGPVGGACGACHEKFQAPRE